MNIQNIIIHLHLKIKHINNLIFLFMNLKSFLMSGLLALLSVTFVFGQSNSNVTIGVRGGLTMPGFTGGSGDPLSDGYSSTTRLGAGIFAEFKISNLFSIQPMLEYSQEGAKRNGMQALIATASDQNLYGGLQQAMQGLQQMGVGNGSVPTYLYADVNSIAKMDFLMLPVLAKFGWNFTKSSPWRVYIDAGPYIGLLVNAKNTVTGNVAIYGDPEKNLQIPPAIPPAMLQVPGVQQMVDGMNEIANGLYGTQDIKNKLHTVTWGLEGNVGLQYQINFRNKVFIEGGGNYCMMNIQKSTGNGQYLNGKNHIGAATLMIGYGYAL